MSFDYPEPASDGRLHWTDKRRPVRHSTVTPRLEAWIGGPSDDPNLLYEGDNLDAVSDLTERGLLGRFQLVYLDPPFCSGRSYKRTIRLHGSTVPEQAATQLVQYEDSWNEDLYLQFCYERFLASKALLNDTGSFVLHVDEHMSHMLRCVLDEVFGRENFVNEIVWHYPDNFQGNVKGLANNHNLIFWYKKTQQFKSHPIRVPLEKPRKRDRRVWDKTLKKVVAARDEKGNIIYDMYTDRRADDVWRIGQSSVTKIRSHEHTGYPTQKPQALLTRIIEATTDPGDWVFDGFSGSGTTAATAQKLNRRWAVCDQNRGAIQTLDDRLLRSFNLERSGSSKPVAHVCLKHNAHPSAGEVTLTVARTEVGATLEITGLRLEDTHQPGPPIASNWVSTIDSVRIDSRYSGSPFCTTRGDLPSMKESAKLIHQFSNEDIGEDFSLRVVDVYGREFRTTGKWGVFEG